MVKNIIICFAFLIFAAFKVEVKSQPKVLVLADFDNDSQHTNLGEDFGTWDGFPSDSSQSCKIKLAEDDALGKEKGKSLQLDYDVDSPNPAYNGFWMKISKAEVLDFDTLSFYLKGDSKTGFTSKIKVELKDKKRGKATFWVDNMTEKWQKISLTLEARSFIPNQPQPFEEFVIVFDDINSQPKSGRLFIDQIEFSKN